MNRLNPYVVKMDDGSSFVLGATDALQAKELASYISTLPIVSVALHPYVIVSRDHFASGNDHHSASDYWSSVALGH
jgi:hypothetical protein